MSYSPFVKLSVTKAPSRVTNVRWKDNPPEIEVSNLYPCGDDRVDALAYAMSYYRRKK